MKSRQKKAAEIEARLERFDGIIAGLKQKAREEKQIDPATEKRIDELSRKRDEMHGKLEALDQSDESTWEALKSELDDYMKDMDKDHRGSLSFFK
jgi:hypothetical protein